MPIDIIINKKVDEDLQSLSRLTSLCVIKAAGHRAVLCQRVQGLQYRFDFALAGLNINYGETNVKDYQMNE